MLAPNYPAVKILDRTIDKSIEIEKLLNNQSNSKIFIVK